MTVTDIKRKLNDDKVMKPWYWKSIKTWKNSRALFDANFLVLAWLFLFIKNPHDELTTNQHHSSVTWNHSYEWPHKSVLFWMPLSMLHSGIGLLKSRISGVYRCIAIDSENFRTDSELTIYTLYIYSKWLNVLASQNALMSRNECKRSQLCVNGFNRQDKNILYFKRDLCVSVNESPTVWKIILKALFISCNMVLCSSIILLLSLMFWSYISLYILIFLLFFSTYFPVSQASLRLKCMFAPF